ncbi:hypothetical protein UNSWDHB_2613 [Dehalobacter sp. UNSWDHB]|uniref:hypothetical protein n=1 Tax=Dehalobacter sp. UNSWDHB TaxID=1339256 RepID=UPI0003877706|nr:hypothetical protein [Dehalobacter sp. UNSWDHB]EQB20027.1 hypothetical protein UNSWDHB_2613 [Dehalobacter sp. UNSWDHB]
MSEKRKAVVCYSGGHSSALVAIEAVKRFGKENVILLNHNISSHVEHADIKRFKREVAEYVGIPITYANAENEETPLEVCRRKQAFQIGNGQTLCTHYLKTRPFHLWLLDNFPASGCAPCEEIVILYGFDKDEPDRITRRSQLLGLMGYKTDFPLACWDRTIGATEEIGIARPSTYNVYKHANCTGCLKAGKQHWYCVFCLRPDIWDEAKIAEAEIGYSIIKGVFLEELEPQFTKMRDTLKICPTDKGNSATFWARVNKAIPEQQSLFPCECSF